MISRAPGSVTKRGWGFRGYDCGHRDREDIRDREAQQQNHHNSDRLAHDVSVHGRHEHGDREGAVHADNQSEGVAEQRAAEDNRENAPAPPSEINAKADKCQFHDGGENHDGRRSLLPAVDERLKLMLSREHCERQERAGNGNGRRRDKGTDIRVTRELTCSNAGKLFDCQIIQSEEDSDGEQGQKPHPLIDADCMVKAESRKAGRTSGELPEEKERQHAAERTEAVNEDPRPLAGNLLSIAFRPVVRFQIVRDAEERGSPIQ